MFKKLTSGSTHRPLSRSSTSLSDDDEEREGRERAGKGMRTGIPRPREKNMMKHENRKLHYLWPANQACKLAQGLGGQGQHALQEEKNMMKHENW